MFHFNDDDLEMDMTMNIIAFVYVSKSFEQEKS